MINWFKDNVFELYGKDYKRRDTYKNEDGEGLQERFSQTLSTSLDDLTDNSITKLLDNIYVPATIEEKLIKYLQYNLGINLYLGENNVRKVLKNITKYYQIKGTQRAYDVLFNTLGFSNTVTIVGSLSVSEFDSEGKFDSGLLFDATESPLGLTCLECVSYEIALTGSLIMTADIERAILSVITFNEPINYNLNEVTYNGLPINTQPYILLNSNDVLAYSDTDLIIYTD